jgi:hypothetical protein
LKSQGIWKMHLALVRAVGKAEAEVGTRPVGGEEDLTTWELDGKVKDFRPELVHKKSG